MTVFYLQETKDNCINNNNTQMHFSCDSRILITNKYNTITKTLQYNQRASESFLNGTSGQKRPFQHQSRSVKKQKKR